MIKGISINTAAKCAFVDITPKVEEAVRESKVKEGLAHIFVPHTTAGVVINENADPSVKQDIAAQLSKLAPEDGNYSHAEGNSPGHIKSSIVGPSQTVFIDDGRLLLGTWQGIFFCEFDGPRKRSVFVKITS